MDLWETASCLGQLGVPQRTCQEEEFTAILKRIKCKIMCFLLNGICRGLHTKGPTFVLCICTSKCMQGLCMCVRTHVTFIWLPEEIVSCHSLDLILLLLRQRLSTVCLWLHLLALAVTEPQGSFCLCFPRPWVTSMGL